MTPTPMDDGAEYNLPRPLTSFVGRNRELSEVVGLLKDHRLVTIAGAGGSGKTRLAVEAAHERISETPNGAWFVDLAPLRTPNQVVLATLDALGTSRGTDDPLEAVLERVGPLDLLVLMDNCEHLRWSVAALVTRILRKCPNAAILATSREPLGVSGEVVWQIPAMALPAGAGELPLADLRELPAVGLFLSRGRAANTAFDLTASNREAVVRACRAVDALPLGLELAAARLAALSVEELADRLVHNLGLLSSRGWATPERQRTMEAAIAWSFDLLSADEKTVFRRLAVFNGGWTLVAAEEICPGVDVKRGEIVDILGALVEQSLVVADVVGELPRYHFLETVREFALEKLRASGEDDPIGGRHCQWFREFAEGGARNLAGAQQRLWLDRLESEHDNFRNAMVWAEDHELAVVDGLLLAQHLQWFWHDRGYAAEGFERTQSLLARDAGEHPAARAGALVTATWCAISVAPFPVCAVLGAEAVALARKLADDDLLGRALHAVGHSLCFPGRPPGAVAALLEARELLEMTGNRALLVRVLHSLSVVESEAGASDSAMGLVRQGLAIAEELDFGSARALFLMQLGDGERVRGNHAEAGIYLKRASNQAQVLNIRRLAGIIALNIGLLAIAQGDLNGANRHLGHSLQRAQRESDRRCMAMSIIALAAVRGQEGDTETAARWLEGVERSHPGFRASVSDESVRDLAYSLAYDVPPRLSNDMIPTFHGSLGKLAAEVLSMVEAVPAATTESRSVEGPHEQTARPETILTRREVEVVRLIAAGRSNQEVAALLVISLNTVERHVTNLYGKINARNRADATVYALQHGLAMARPTE
ncbi:MAG: LuxR C-terminal-related transcriptional regulator [Tepidiformaceae bacterium]